MLQDLHTCFPGDDTKTADHKMLKVKEVAEIAYHKGLEKMDFVKASNHLLSCDEVDTLAEMGLGVELPKNPSHLINQLTDKEIDSICYDRRGKIPAYNTYAKDIGKALDVPPDWLPEGFVDAQLILSAEQANGKRSYKNFLRRLERETRKNTPKKKLVKSDAPHDGICRFK